METSGANQCGYSCRQGGELESLADFSAEYGESRTLFKSQAAARAQNMVEYRSGNGLSLVSGASLWREKRFVTEELQLQDGVQNATRKMPQVHLPQNIADISKLWLNRVNGLEAEHTAWRLRTI